MMVWSIMGSILGLGFLFFLFACTAEGWSFLLSVKLQLSNLWYRRQVWKHRKEDPETFRKLLGTDPWMQRRQAKERREQEKKEKE